MRTTAIAALLCFALSAAAQTSYTNFESSPVHPIRVSPDGSRLFVVNAPDARLEVYGLGDPGNPKLLKTIPVGMEPISCTPRTDDEVWVVNSLSDSISIVSVSAGRIVATLRVKDEPADVVFAGSPQRAFVTAQASDQVRVFDPVTRTQVAQISIFGKDPRSMATDSGGTKVYVLVHKSGNRSALVPVGPAPAPPAPTNPALPAAPAQGIIVDIGNPTWSASIPHTLPDNDIVEISTTTLSVTRTMAGIGTTNYDVAVHPTTGDLWVANTEARNLVRFEPNVKGHAIDSRVTRVTTAATPVITPIDLNPGINYAVLPNPSALSTALAEPKAVAFSANGNELFVAAEGTDRIGVLDGNGTVLARIESGSTSTSTKRGPRALAVHPGASRLYVYNHLSLSLSVVDTTTRLVIREVPLANDPEPAGLRSGRKFLYDAKLSGNGTMSCASCHIDGDTDLMAWDLGDPAGSMIPTPMQPFPFSVFLPQALHPMKGPMVTQTLKGLAGIAPLHWRGDRVDVAAFNGAFASLLGGTPLGATDLALFVGFMNSAVFPPNPNQNMNRTYATTPASANPQEGLNVFMNTTVAAGFGINLTCATCHALPTGTSNMLISQLLLQEPQAMKVPQIRNVYRRAGGAAGNQPAKTAFTFTHDGALSSVAAFLALPVFNPWPSNKKDDLTAFVMAFDTGTAPTVGYQVTIDATNAGSPSVAADVQLLQGQAAAGNCHLIAKGTINGLTRGLVYSPSNGTWSTDDPSLGTFTWPGLMSLAASSQANLTFTGVPIGSATRLGVDHDDDGAADALDGLRAYGTPGAGSFGPLELGGNREPATATNDFAFVISNAPPASAGVVGFSPLPTNVPFGAVTAYIDYTIPGFFAVGAVSDPHRLATYEAPIPAVPGLAGYTIYAQAAFYDAGVAGNYVASNGLEITIQ